MKPVRMLVGGELVDGALETPVINPATEQPVMSCPRADRAQLDAAAAAAKAAFPAWSRSPIQERRKALLEMAETLETNAEELAILLTSEQGKPLASARLETLKAADAFRCVARLDLSPRTLEDNRARRVEMRRRPLGVVAAIVPWNFPLALMSAKLPYALLAGNTVVLKPAPTTPLATLRFGELAKDLLPPGVLNIIADAGDLGAALAAHPDVSKISFTGSTATGRKVMASAAPSLKRLTLELGGNDAAIVLDDADVAAIAPRIFNGAFRNAGQICAAVKRLYVAAPLHDDMCEALAQLADAAIVGDGMDEATQMGPLQNRPQFDRVCDLIEHTRNRATILTGGRMDRPGYFVRPTVVRDIADGERLVEEEQFGPVLPVMRYEDPEDALRRANSSPYGLGGSIWSSDRSRALAYAERMEAGTVWINKHAEMDSGIPFAGSKQSGIGVEMSDEGLAEFTQIHVINAAVD
jgi:acyl-CoA reductase-like NAD-dependent aldehyde dehydrogenase